MEQLQVFLKEFGAFLREVIRPAARSVRENSGLAALSVFLAFGLWIFVTDAENPERTDRIEERIPIRPVNVPADIWVPEAVGEVVVDVRVEENVFDSLTKEDFQATVDLESFPVGVHRPAVNVIALTDRGNLRVVSWSPEEIDVTLEQLLSKRVPLDVEVKGSPPADFLLSSPVADTNTAVVAGPQDGVGAVTKVVAPVDVEGRTEPFESAVRLEPRDQLGNLVEKVEVEPAFMNVRVEIEQQSFSRSLAVSPTLQGTPRQGYNVVGVTVEPAVVTVFGSQTFIEQAVAIATQAINIEDASEDISRTVSLELPSGVTVRGGANVTVTVTVSPAPGQLMFVVPLSVTGLGEGLSISGSLPSVQVFVFGPLPELQELDPNDLTASVDLEGKDAGNHTVAVSASGPEGLEVRSVSPAEIEITLVSG